MHSTSETRKVKGTKDVWGKRGQQNSRKEDAEPSKRGSI